MADETRIEPGASHRLFSEIESVAVDIDAALARVRSVRSTVAQPWGTDETGRKFSQNREPNAEQLLGYVAKASGFARDLGKEGHGAVNQFVEQDNDNSANLS